MVVDIPTIPSIFPQSRADDDGFGANVEQRRKNEGALGPSRLSLMKFNTGDTESNVPEVLDFIKFAKGDFLVGERCEVKIMLNDDSTVSKGDFSFRVTDSKGNVVYNIGTGFWQDDDFVDVALAQDVDDNTNLFILGTRNRESQANPIKLWAELNLTDEDVFTTDWTLEIIGNRNTGGKLYWSWWVYRRGLV